MKSLSTGRIGTTGPPSGVVRNTGPLYLSNGIMITVGRSVLGSAPGAQPMSYTLPRAQLHRPTACQRLDVSIRRALIQTGNCLTRFPALSSGAVAAPGP